MATMSANGQGAGGTAVPGAQAAPEVPAARAVAPLVSIITPAYNAERFIGDTVESVLAQTYENWELVLVDDNSKDGTVARVESFGDPRIRVVQAGGTGRPSAARNVGLRAARGEYVAFLDHDDIWRPTKLEKQVAILRARPEIGLVHTASDLMRGGVVEATPPDPEAAREDRVAERLLAGNFIYASSVLLRRSLIDEHGGQDEDFELRATPDYEHWLRLAPVTGFAYVDEPLLVYRLHDANVTANLAQVALGIQVAVEKTIRRYPHLAGLASPAQQRMIGIHACIAGMPGGGRAELRRYVLRHPADAVAWKWLLLSHLPAGARTRLLARRQG